MSALSRLMGRFTGKAPADVVASEVYAAMCAKPAHVVLADKLLRASVAQRAALLERVDEATRAAALAWMSAPDERERRLQWLRADPMRVGALHRYYRSSVADFISDWMTIVDTRRTAKDQVATVAFTLWPKQREMVAFIMERIRLQQPGVIVKGRDVGASSVALATLAACCIFREDFAAGVISSTEAKLEKFNDTLFMKLRGLLRSLPLEFNGGYDPERSDMHLSIRFPLTRSVVTGATGDQAHRGSRQTVVVVDEAAFLQDSQAIDSALSAVSDARIDISTPHGIGGSFYDRAHNDAIPRLDLSWRDDPRRDEAWFQKIVATEDPVTVAQEYNCDFAASREGTLIPALWVQSSIGLAERLKIEPSGARYAALDLGDTGDRCAIAIRHGCHLLHVESWSGAGSDLLRSLARAFAVYDEWKCADGLVYDGGGMGASVKGDARALNAAREKDKQILVDEYLNSQVPMAPKRIAPRTNRRWEDLCANRGAQAGWSLRARYEEAHKAASGEPYDADSLILVNPQLRELSRFTAEMSQPTMSENSAGKLVIDKAPKGTRSPNLYDCVAMVFAPRKPRLHFSDSYMEQSKRLPREGFF